MSRSRKKLYVYVDESGQDSKGLIFVVGVLIIEKDREVILKKLEEIEKATGKGIAKWHKSRHEFRQKYIEQIRDSGNFRKTLFFEVFSDTKKYSELTSFATAKAILQKVGRSDDYKATVFVDGLRKNEIDKFRKGLKDLRVNVKKIRGVKKEENNAFIRLADALCGLIRDADGKNSWTRKILEDLQERKVAKEL